MKLEMLRRFPLLVSPIGKQFDAPLQTVVPLVGKQRHRLSLRRPLSPGYARADPQRWSRTS
jgi:hypothetical protein